MNKFEKLQKELAEMFKFMYADLIREYAFERTESDNESFVRWLTGVIKYDENPYYKNSKIKWSVIQ